jgi:hypothetical protein
MFADVRDAAIHSSKDLKLFRDNWDSEQTREVLARAKASNERDGDLSRAREVKGYGWAAQ